MVACSPRCEYKEQRVALHNSFFSHHQHSIDYSEHPQLAIYQSLSQHTKINTINMAQAIPTEQWAQVVEQTGKRE
jgi:hypothetical protein